MEEWNKKIPVSQYGASLLIAFLVTLVPTFSVLVMQVRTDSLTGEMNNLRIYIMTALVFMITLLTSVLVCKVFFFSGKHKWNLHITCWAYVLYLGGILLNVWYLIKCYLNSTNVYPYMSGEWFPWHKKPNWQIFFLMFLIGIIAIGVSLWNEKGKKIFEVARFPLYLLASAIGGASMYCSNLFAGDFLHGNAYYASVYQAVIGAPFDYNNQSVYGHYAIFLKYPVKMLGGDYTAFNIVIAIVGAMSIFMVALALDLCVKNHFISIIGTWAIPMMYLYYPKNHWQMFPHRILSASFLLYVIARYFHKREKWMKLTGYTLAGLAILWNAETGIICLGTWILASIIFEIVNRVDDTRVNLMKSVLRNMMYSILTLGGMVCLFNLYNMPLGEKWHGFRFLMFPLDAGWDMPGLIEAQAAEETGSLFGAKLMELWVKMNNTFASGLMQPLIYEISPWYLVFLLFGIAIVLVVVRALYNRARANDYVIGLASILALGQLYYFFNRPCFDYLAIAQFEAILIMAIWSDERSGWEYAWMKRPHQFLFISILSILSVFTLWQARFRFGGRIAEGYYDSGPFNEVLRDIEENVPKDTFAFGHGIEEVYAQLGWNTGCHVSDYSSWANNHSIGAVIVNSSGQEECVISVRNKKKNGMVSAEEYMGWWGFERKAISVKEHWNLDIDETWYWDIYYIEIDKNFDNYYYDKYKGTV